ncbi:MAG: DNA cytosine methyltransferase [Siphonobacter sp.]
MIQVPGIYQQALKSQRFIDLFAGIGGFHLALNSYGAKAVFASEIDRQAQLIYQKNFGIIPGGDITKIAEDQIPAHDILCGGFPCQPFSISGKQRGFEDARGTLFFDIARITAYHKPWLVFLENVSHLEKHDDGKTLLSMSRILQNLGYTVFHQVLNAAHFGIPQRRQRLFIIAFKQELGVKTFTFPKATFEVTNLKCVALPEEESKAFVLDRDDYFLKNYEEQHDLFGETVIAEPIRIGHVNLGRQGERIYHESGAAITLSAHGGGIGAKTGLYLIDGKVRKLAPRECARLMGFPDDFQIHESSAQAYKQFGNAVVVDVVQHIIREIIEQGINV